MKLLFNVNDELYDITIKDENVLENNQNKINRSVKTILKRVYKKDLLDVMLNDFGYNIEKCRLCDIEYPPVYGVFVVSGKNISLNGFTYQKEIYCYCKNKECPGKKMNPNSVEFISKLNKVDEIEAMKILKSRNKSPFYAENWDNIESYKDYQRRDESFFNENSDISYEEYVNKISFANSLEGYIAKFGDVEGTRIFNEVSLKKDSMSMKYCLEKCDTEEEALYLYELRKKSVNVSLESLINKHGVEKGNAINESRNAKLSYNTTIDAYIERHGVVDGTEKYIQRLKTISYKGTFAYYKEKYGDDADMKWLERTIARRSCMNDFIKLYGDNATAREKRLYYISRRSVTASVSKESVSFFDKLTDYIVNVLGLNKDTIFYNHGRELKLISDKTFYLYDYTIADFKLIIEYNGVKFHPNKEELSVLEWKEWKSARGNKTADESYTRQTEKIEWANSQGYEVLEIWSNKTFAENFDISINFIKEKTNIK